MSFILSLDQGTTSSRAIIFDKAGSIIAVAQREFEQIFPKPGWVEHNAKEIWDSQLAVAREALEKAGATAADISGIGITNQRETTVVWDRATGEPIANAIVWQDRRTADYCRGLKEAGHAENIQKKTGLVLDAYFSGSKVRWLLDNTEGARAKAEAGELAFGTMDSWLVWNLTGGKVHITDASNASRTLLFNIETMSWDDELLELLNVPASVLPEVRQSSEVYGESTDDCFGGAIPIAGIAGDQHAALFGQACHKSGMAKNTFGTGCFMLMNTGTEMVRSTNDLLTTVAWKVDGQVEYALEGSIFIAGAVVQWLRDQLGIIESAPDVEALAASVEDNGGVYFVPAFSGLGSPHWDPYARGTIAGLTRGSSKGHIARAALEGIAYQVMDILKAMEADSGISLQELRVDGGASMNALLMQFQSDILGVPVVRPQTPETTALGAAYLAGLATGYWSSRDEISEQWGVDARFEPNMDADKVSSLVAGWQKAVGRAKAWEDQG
ncbi:MAG: glycerol kinase GlpK [Verrucomicrobia bacterium]|nr:glycerol kinase GlpK [Verrucomicrobiota bacterium]MDA1068260.1 glycerol kinase GlpK [Verrucomicrobiota bacterium]